MFDLRKIPMLRVLVPFFAGVWSTTHLSSKIQITGVIFLSIFLWLTMVAIYRWQWQRPGRIPLINAPLLFLLIFTAGTGSGILSRPQDPGLPVDRWVVVRGEAAGAPSPHSFAHSFDLKLQILFSDDTFCRTNTVLKVYLSMPADSQMPAAGEIWQFSGKLVPIRNSGNPGSPDFRSIMGRKNCWYRFYASNGAEQTLFNREVKVPGRRLSPAGIRKNVSDHWYGDPEKVSLLKAVCLGDRSSLTDDMRQAYSAAGGMHLLAVSGLHVGLIWWVLQYMTAWMSFIFRNGKQRALLVVALLWFFAFLTGFSSSVCRSVTMFSFFSASRMMGKRLHPINVILASAFLLVLVDPQRLMDVGFQLSYAAITGIVTIHPLSMKLVRVKMRILRWIWEATSVSLAAQLSTAPLVIFYFHHLPVYSLLTSLLAVPMLSLLIAIFVCSVPFISVGILEKVFSFLLVELAGLMNRSMEFLSSLPGAVLDDLHMNRITMLLWLLVFLLLIIALHDRRKIPAYLLMFLISFFLAWNSCSGLKRRSSSALIITHFRGASMIIIREGLQVDHYCWSRDSTSLDYMKSYSDACWSRRIYKKQLYGMGDDVQFTGKISSCIQLTDGAWILGGGAYSGVVLTAGLNTQCLDTVLGSFLQEQAEGPYFILLSGEPKVDVLQLSSRIGDAVLVIDGSNRNWYRDRVMAEWGRIYLTDRSGAYVKRW